MKLLAYLEKNYKAIYLLAMLLTALWVAYIKGWILAPFANISAKEALKLIKSKEYIIIDIRNKDAYKKGHITNAISMPSKIILNEPNKLAKYKNSKILIYSKTGQEGIKICRLLSKNGYRVINVKSGILGLAIVGAKEPKLFSK